MTDPIIQKAVNLKKELEDPDYPELAAKTKPMMDEIMKIILGATQAPSGQKKS